MKEYQARTADGTRVCVSFQNLEHAKSAFRVYKSFPETDIRRSWILVLAEWESEAEADKARLDWISECGFVWNRKKAKDKMSRDEARGMMDSVIDHYRQAPKPTVTKVEI